MAITPPCRCANGNENRFRINDALLERGRKTQSASGRIIRDQFVQARFIDRDFSFQQHRALGRIRFEDGNVYAKFGETSA